VFAVGRPPWLTAGSAASAAYSRAFAEPFGAAVLIEHTNGNHLRGVFSVGDRHLSGGLSQIEAQRTIKSGISRS
jgi:hypothetical protein